MKSQLYVPKMTKDYLKSEITSYVGVYFEKLLPVFKDMESQADKYENDFYNDFIGPGYIAEKALEIGIEHYSYLRLGKYILTATWHATLYQLWEQQLRAFLFREISSIYKLEFKTFCTTIAVLRGRFPLFKSFLNPAFH